MRQGLLNNNKIDVVTGESVGESSTLTTHPVESGTDIVDHVKNDPLQLHLEGAFVGPNAWERLKPLRDMKRKRELCRWVGRNIFDNMIIVSLETNHTGENSEGADFTMTLQQADIVKGKRFTDKVKGNKTKTQVAKRTSQGRKQVMSK